MIKIANDDDGMQNSVENLNCFAFDWYKNCVGNTRSCEIPMEFRAESSFTQFYLHLTTDLQKEKSTQYIYFQLD